MDKIIMTASYVDRMANRTGVKQVIIQFLQHAVTVLIPYCMRKTKEIMDEHEKIHLD
jgi:hypothetical protein